MDVVVFGAGSLGSLVGGMLARAHSVTLVGRDPHVAAVRESGLRVGDVDEFTVRPNATTDGRNLTAELAVVTVKAFDTEAAAADLATGSFETVLSLQNGMGNEDVLADALDCPVLAGTVTYGAVLHDPGFVECTGHGEVVLGSRDAGSSELADGVGDAFTAADIKTSVVDDMPRRLWEKLAVNAGINPVTALADVPNGAVRDGPAQQVAADAARETARVARAASVSLTDNEVVDALNAVAAATAENTSSMLQDVRRGRRTEIDAINGYVVDHGNMLNEPTPVNATLAALVRTREKS